MKRLTALFMMIAGLWCSPAYAVLPVEGMSPTSLGVDYSGMWRGEKITKRNIPGHESAHHLNLRYAPVPYVLLSLGFGAANFTVDTSLQTQFKGTYNFSPSLGFSLYSPFLIKKTLRVTAGAKAYYLYTRNKEKSHIYSGPFVNPEAGAVVSIGEYIDLEAGARGNMVFGRMQENREPALNFSNSQRIRAYLSAMIYAPSEGAYFLFDFDASPKIDMDWSRGPAESAIGITVGIILRQNKDKLRKKLIDDPDFPGYREMQKKTEEMEQELK